MRKLAVRDTHSDFLHLFVLLYSVLPRHLSRRESFRFDQSFNKTFRYSKDLEKRQQHC
jgi:hypothetical protein